MPKFKVGDVVTVNIPNLDEMLLTDPYYEYHAGLICGYLNKECVIVEADSNSNYYKLDSINSRLMFADVALKPAERKININEEDVIGLF